MTGSYQGKSVVEHAQLDARRGFGPARGKRDKKGGLLYLRSRNNGSAAEPQFYSAGGALTLLGVAAGLTMGYLIYQFGIVKPNTSVRYFMVWLMAVPALVGGAVGAVTAWMRLRGRLAQALVTSEGFRQRLMNVERNQALWVSLSAVLHDVRNPLHNISLLVESLGAPEVDVERVRIQIGEQLDRIHARVRRVTSQMAELSGEIERQSVDIDSVLAEVKDMIEPLARQVGAAVRVSLGEHLRVVADPKFLVQAVDHLILNSLQSLSEQPLGRPRSIEIRRRCVKSVVELWIEDSGPGLPEDVRKRLFEPLTTSRTNGMGLGLAIAHALVTAAGAELALGHTGADGTRFVLRMPCVR